MKQKLHAYLAGLFDGEGTVWKNRQNGYVWLHFTNTSLDLCELFRNEFGGSVHEHPGSIKTCYRWIATGKAAKKAKDAMQSYLRLKKIPEIHLKSF